MVPHRGVKHKVGVVGYSIRDWRSFMETGGPTYLAMAILRLASNSPECLSESEKRRTLRWLLQNQDTSGGFRGRTNKDADACYCFWCGGAIQVPSLMRSRLPFTNLLARYSVQRSL